MFHIPVLVDEILNELDLKENFIFVDCTIGGGGHTKTILEKFPYGKIIGVDQDQDAISWLEKDLGEYENKISLINDNFNNLKFFLAEKEIYAIDGILFDLGTSSYQLKDENRGFSFRIKAPLDMRMNIKEDTTAYDIVNTFSFENLRDIIVKYGEERFASKIARFIIDKRPIKDSLELANLIERAVGYYYKKLKIHPATRTFQALRIAVNKELENLESGLEQAIMLLKKDAKIFVISYHSLEDRIAKHTFKKYSKDDILGIITKKPIIPQQDEIIKNRAARSAKLRIGVKIK
ncbi:MAG: 16S rRNA (cytosine(1402)-N(4))-methyltransferase RsmH [bacterium]